MLIVIFENGINIEIHCINMIDHNPRFIVCNWKSGGSLSTCRSIATLIKMIDEKMCDEVFLSSKIAIKRYAHLGSTKIIFAPPDTHLYSLNSDLDLIRSERGVGNHSSADDIVSYSICAQDINRCDTALSTGSTNLNIIKDIGCKYVILGHSEVRNTFGDTDDVVAYKAAHCIANDMVPIICIGESGESKQMHDRRKSGDIVENQLKSILHSIVKYYNEILEKYDMNSENIAERILNEGRATENVCMLIAYEPIWAIGSNKAAAPEFIEYIISIISEVIESFRKSLLDLDMYFGKLPSCEICILYGGSVSSSSYRDIISIKGLSGVLLGRASLDVASFGRIMEIHFEKAIDLSQLNYDEKLTDNSH